MIKKICFIGLFDAKTDGRSLNMAQALARLGHEVTIVNTGDTTTSKIIRDSGYSCINIAVDLRRKLRYIWLDYQREVISKLKRYKFDVILACDVYSLGAASKLTKVMKSMLVYDSREIYSALGSLRGKDLQQYFITLNESMNLKRVSKIIVSGNLDSEYLKKSLTSKVPYYTVMNLPYSRPKIESNIIREKFNLSKDTKVVLYQGMLMKGRGLLNAIQAVAQIENTVLCIMGVGSYRHEIQKFIEKNNFQDKAFIADPVPYGELHLWTCSADTGILLFEPVSKSYQLALPNKLFEYCMAGIPSVATDLPAIRQVTDTDKISLLVGKELIISEIATAIKQTFDTDFRNEFNSNYSKYSSKYCYETQYDTINEIFDI
ncbi:MAG: glycosyltransferase [Candidatus Kapabacteria bacterium]|nr:glycosyltransferase [Candidatus Kapabacteria bacterium]